MQKNVYLKYLSRFFRKFYIRVWNEKDGDARFVWHLPPRAHLTRGVKAQEFKSDITLTNSTRDHSFVSICSIEIWAQRNYIGLKPRSEDAAPQFYAPQFYARCRRISSRTSEKSARRHRRLDYINRAYIKRSNLITCKRTTLYTQVNLAPAAAAQITG